MRKPKGTVMLKAVLRVNNLREELATDTLAYDLEF